MLQCLVDISIPRSMSVWFGGKDAVYYPARDKQLHFFMPLTVKWTTTVSNGASAGGLVPCPCSLKLNSYQDRGSGHGGLHWIRPLVPCGRDFARRIRRKATGLDHRSAEYRRIFRGINLVYVSSC